MAGLPKSISGLRPLTQKNLILDAGCMWANINLALLRSSGSFAQASAPGAGWTDPNGNMVYPAKLGATRRGARVFNNFTEREVEVDGSYTRYKGMRRRDMAEPYIEATLLEMGAEDVLKIALGSTKVDVWPETGPIAYLEHTPTMLIDDEDYIGNVAIAATLVRETEPFLIVLDNARNDETVEIPFEHHNEVATSVRLYGHALLTAPLDIPLHYFLPVQFGS